MKAFERILKIAGLVVASILTIFIIGSIAILLFLDHVAPPSITSLGDFPSDNGKHIVQVYLYNGGATTPYTVVARVSGDWIIGKRTIYSVDNEEDVVVAWIDDHTVNVNGAILNIYWDKCSGDVYDLEGR